MNLLSDRLYSEHEHLHFMMRAEERALSQLQVDLCNAKHAMRSRYDDDEAPDVFGIEQEIIMAEMEINLLMKKARKTWARYCAAVDTERHIANANGLVFE